MLQFQDKNKEALTRFERALDIDPENKEALYGKGLAFIALGKATEAASIFDKIIQIDPKNYQAYKASGLALEASGKYPEALKVYEKALEINSGPVALNDKMHALILAKKTIDAVGLLLTK